MKARTIFVAGAAWLAAAGAWAQPGRVVLKTGEMVEARSLRMEDGKYRLVLPDGSSRTVVQEEVRSVQFLEEQSEIDRWVKDLGAEDHGKREEATKRLVGLLGHDRERVLAALPEEPADPEVKVRAEAIRERASRGEGMEPGKLKQRTLERQDAAGQIVPEPRLFEAVRLPLDGAKGFRLDGRGGIVRLLPMGGAKDPSEEAVAAKDVPPAAPGEIDQLVKDLGSERFASREKAMERLKDLVRSSENEKEKVLAVLPKDSPDMEVQSRLDEILASPQEQGEPGQRYRLGVGMESNHAGGVRIVQVIKGSPAQKAGMEEGDVIVKFGEAEIRSPEDLATAVQGDCPKNKPIVVTVLRQAKEINLKVMIGKADLFLRPEDGLPQPAFIPERWIDDLPPPPAPFPPVEKPLERIEPAAPGEIERLVKDLGAEEFPKREEATKRLVEIGRSDKEKVLAALPKDSGDPEVRARVGEVRKLVEGKGDSDPDEVKSDVMQGGNQIILRIARGKIAQETPDAGKNRAIKAEKKDVAPAGPGEIERLVKDLGNAKLEAREKATERLRDLVSIEQEKVLAALPKEPAHPEVHARAEWIRGVAEMKGMEMPASLLEQPILDLDLHVSSDGQVHYRGLVAIRMRNGACLSSSRISGAIDEKRPNDGVPAALGRLSTLLSGTQGDDLRDLAAKLVMRMSDEKWPEKDRARLAIEWIGKQKADPKFVLPKEGVQESEKFQR